jgi:hypothetical protein
MAGAIAGPQKKGQKAEQNENQEDPPRDHLRFVLR